VVDWVNNRWELILGDKAKWEELIQDFENSPLPEIEKFEALKLEFSTSFEDYEKHFNAIKNHIRRGDIYEMNYCIQAEAKEAVINPIVVFQKLQSLSAAPFSAFFKFDNCYLLSSSPERYLAKRDNKIISQPIKGTAKRMLDPELDQQAAVALANNAKEQQENVMIVDLVRNDLSRTAAKGSVKVEELFGIYTFPAVHQMISTVVSELKPNISFEELLATTFPMGSMTGAPKISAMQIAEKQESFARAWYSGALGYIEPNGDFDFSVVIRSILYHQTLHHVTLAVGSAITIHAEAEAEYKECLLKAEKLMKAFS
jgi:para-aminobenzoate synthetase component 1